MSWSSMGFYFIDLFQITDNLFVQKFLQELAEDFIMTVTEEGIELKMTHLWTAIENEFNKRYQLHKFGLTQAYR